MAQLFDYIISHYGWQGLALGGAIIVLLCVQIYYYLIVYRRISTYRNARRKKKFEQEPPVSVIIPLFSEDYAYLEERLPYIFSQQYGATFEVVIVYVGNDSDFYEELARLRVLHPNLIVTKFDFNPRFPISIKQAINLGIKSSHNEHIIISTPNAKPASDHWLAMMGKAFMRGDIVIGYSGIEQRTGIGNYLMRMSNLQQSIYWLAQAVNGSAYRGIRHNLGFTKTLYFSVRGFSHLSMNIGEDDLFIQRIAKRNNVSVVMIPKGSMMEHPWGGLCWWLGRMRHYGQTWQFYPDWVHSSIQWDLGSQALLFLTAITALIFMPLEFKVATIILLLLRYLIVALRIRSIAKRVGERGAALKYFIFDLMNPILMMCLGIIMLRKDLTAWK